MKIFNVNELTRRQHEAQWEYVCYWATHPDTESAFARLTCLFRMLPKRLLFFLLVKCFRYDGLVCYDNDMFVGHVFFQKHRQYWGIFSVFVWESQRNKDYAKRMIVECLKRAHDTAGLTRVRIGNGGHPAIQHIAALARGNQLGLPFSVRAGAGKGEVVFSRPMPSEVARYQLAQHMRKL